MISQEVFTREKEQIMAARIASFFQDWTVLYYPEISSMSFVLGLVVFFCMQIPSLHAQPDSSYLAPPRVVSNPGREYSGSHRAFQGIPSLAVSPEGRYWATWYAGKTPGEDRNNYVIVATSGDKGTSWEYVHVVDPDGAGPIRAFDPQIWVAPDGRLRTFWAQAIGHEGAQAGVWTMHTDDPDAAHPGWSSPRRLTDGIMMGKPAVLSSGEWVLPASTWGTERSAKMVVSRDQGRSWHIRGAAHVPGEVRTFDEHQVIERKDGALWMLVRTTYGIGESVSTDRGETWSPVQPSGIRHPSARFFIRRLQSGNLLLVKHGPIHEKTGRSHLTAFLSDDDGTSWTGGLLLDERNGVSYPDGQQTPDGVIHIIYDYSRTDEKEILMARFTEQDIISGYQDSPTVSLRILVDKAVPNGAPRLNSRGSSFDSAHRRSLGGIPPRRPFIHALTNVVFWMAG